jgi:hypothetical protein
MSPREQRIVENEALFREVNAHIARLEDRIGSEEEPQFVGSRRALANKYQPPAL